MVNILGRENVAKDFEKIIAFYTGRNIGLNAWYHVYNRDQSEVLNIRRDDMIQHIYPEQMTSQNITYGLIGGRISSGKRNFGDLSNNTVIIVIDEIMDETLIRATAHTILSKGCKNVAFCGTASDEWQAIFDEIDREINGFNDLTGYEDFAVMWRFEDIDSLQDEVSSCWNEVLILCSSMTILRDCQDALREDAWV